MAVTAKREYFVKNTILLSSFLKVVLGQFSTAFGLCGGNIKSRILKLLRSLRIDSKEPIPSGCVAWLADTTALFLLGSFYTVAPD
jgi:hypothetical protein